MSKKVLFLEDDESLLKIVKRWIGKDADTLADFVMNCKDAKNKIEKIEYDLYILDFSISDGTAEDIVDYSKKCNKNTPYVIFSAYDKKQIVDRIKDIGFMDQCLNYVRKDNIQEFKNAVEKYIRDDDIDIFKNIGKKLDNIRHIAYECAKIIEENAII